MKLSLYKWERAGALPNAGGVVHAGQVEGRLLVAPVEGLNAPCHRIKILSIARLCEVAHLFGSTCAGIFEQSMGARNRLGKGLSYRPARLCSRAELVPWNRFMGSLKV